MTFLSVHALPSRPWMSLNPPPKIPIWNILSPFGILRSLSLLMCSFLSLSYPLELPTLSKSEGSWKSGNYSHFKFYTSKFLQCKFTFKISHFSSAISASKILHSLSINAHAHELLSKWLGIVLAKIRVFAIEVLTLVVLSCRFVHKLTQVPGSEDDESN